MPLTAGDKTWIEDSTYRVLTKFYANIIEPRMATKDDLKNLETKMGKLDHKLSGQINELSKKVDSLDDKVSTLEQTRWSVADQHGKKLDNHEKRIQSLELNRRRVLA